jgi:hypothetical protein
LRRLVFLVGQRKSRAVKYNHIELFEDIHLTNLAQDISTSHQSYNTQKPSKKLKLLLIPTQLPPCEVSVICTNVECYV